MLVSDIILGYIKDFTEIIGVAVITAGALYSIYQMFMLVFYKRFTAKNIRLQFGTSIIVGLEFMVAGDIIGSLVRPDYYNLGLLAIIVLIRTILSYFLNKELAELTPHQRETMG